MSTIKYATIEQAKLVVANWNGNASTLKHLGNSGNSVFEYQMDNGQKQILRFTDDSFRTHEDVKGELEYLQHLEQENTPCNYPICTNDKALTTKFETDEAIFICSSLTYVEGEFVTSTSLFWNEDLFKAWGKNLGLIHQASKSYQVEKYKTWEWNEENLFREIDELLPKSDILIKKAFVNILNELAKYPKNINNYGMIHADHAPQNFHYSPERKEIVAFDFGNSCFHWYLSDIAISFTSLRKLPELAQEEVKKYLIKSYTDYIDLPENHEVKIDLFIRLRNIYVYLSRLHWFGANPNQQQQIQLGLTRERVMQAFEL